MGYSGCTEVLKNQTVLRYRDVVRYRHTKVYRLGKPIKGGSWFIRGSHSTPDLIVEASICVWLYGEIEYVAVWKYTVLAGLSKMSKV
jgi:hypothetical protein